MKRLLLVLVVLVVVAGISFAQVEFSGSTAVSAAGNDAEQSLIIEQVVNVSVGNFAVALDSFEYAYAFADKEGTWCWEIDANYALDPFTFGSIAGGDTDLYLDSIQPYVDFAMGPVGADVDFLLSADKDKDVFQGAEFSAFWNPGPLEIRVGYMLTPDGGSAVDENTPDALAGGGVFGKVKLSY